MYWVSIMPIFGRKQDKEYREIARILAAGRTQEAIDRLREFVDENPRHTNALTALGVALIQIQKKPEITSSETEEALDILEKAASINPKDSVPLFNKALIFRELGMLEAALETFEAVLEIEKRMALALLHMAEINYELERWEESIEIARLALIRDPTMAASLSWVKDAMRNAGMLNDDGTAKMKDNIKGLEG
ncbi:MAG: tetratricopeptide repeat protein [Candidatus Thorarchaeota archaeon]|jgi:tetratricopeptide (TPR) repeat protein